MILTAAAIVMILVTMTYSNNLLNTRMAENEFSTNQQFMRTIGLQIDDLAWTIGRTQTVTYSGKYGYIQFQESALNYTFQVHSASGWENLTVAGETGIIMYNIPVSSYSRYNNYFELILNNGSFVQDGSLAPVSQVFCIEKLPMTNGSNTRVVAVPTIRMLNSTIIGVENAKYYKFYLPTLETGSSNYGSQSLSLTGSGITKITRSGIDQVRVNVTFPKDAWGFDNSFFNFNSTTITIPLDTGSSVEFYIGKVLVAVGAGG
jgi:hypothetical protein